MDYKEALLKSLEEENKDKSVKLALEALNTGKITIPFLYEEILKPSLYNIDECKEIGRAHV